MPASSTPTSCTVYLPGHAVEVQYRSQSFHVSPACQNWIQSNAQQDQLWTKQPSSQSLTNALGAPITLVQFCVLTHTSGGVTATVLDESGGIYGGQACTGLVAAGWVEQSGG